MNHQAPRTEADRQELIARAYPDGRYRTVIGVHLVLQRDDTVLLGLRAGTPDGVTSTTTFRQATRRLGRR